ncbi:MAG: N-acetyl-alpha-D-glucosaminyl L-malate synthase BshA [Clostridia bacterium]|nr:N-acetyl-alpha-D-glucosaminyl L-malate synthase BshA [Clostridia bacterium]
MKIGMVCYPTYGGSGVVATELGVHLARCGHEVHFISYDRPFRLNGFQENIFLHEVEISEYPLFKFPPYSIALASQMVEVVNKVGLDLVHAHYAIPHAVSAYLAKQMLRGRLPVITTLHGTDITLVGNDSQFTHITKFCIEESDGVTAVSESLRAETLETFALDKEITTVYNFIDPEEYRRVDNPDMRRYFARPEEKVIIHISNFRPVKRIRDVVRIFAGINEELPSHLLLVGDGPERSAALHLAEKLGVAQRVHFLGKQECVVQLLSIADLFLLPSEKESFGLAALEAMACGVPVVATDIGGIPEVISHGECGYLAPLGDVAQMVRQGLDILINPELHGKMASLARRRTTEKFHVEKIVGQYEEIYRKVTGK